ncbi:MAG: ABC transporter substrate-binding protein [Candidatus Nitrospinota bacterium M3_3B_026]
MMERGRLKTALAAAALFGAIAAALVSCASAPPAGDRLEREPALTPQRPIVPAGPEVRRGAGALYRRAEALFSEKHYGRAAEEYLRFIAGTAPDDPLADNAYFKAGLSYFHMGRYRDALYYFRTAPEKYPGSETSVEAMINAGICHYHLNENGEAEKLFARAAAAAMTPGARAYVDFYMARITEDRGDFMDALDLYVDSERMAEDEKLIDSARSGVGRILRNFLDEQALERVTEKYSGQWPARMAFGELMNVQRRSGAKAALAMTSKRLREQFPPKAAPAPGPGWGGKPHVPVRPKVGVVVPLTGAGAEAGREVAQGIQLAFNSFHGLVREKDIQLIIKDSAGDRALAGKAMEQLAADGDTLIIIGPVFSEAFARAAGVADRHGISVFSPSATAEGLASASAYLFRNCLTSSLEARKMAELAVGVMGLEKIAVLYPDSMEGWEVFDALRDETRRLGGSVEISETYDPGQTDFGEQIKKIGGMSDEQLRGEILAVAKSFPEAEPEYLNHMLEERASGRLTAPRIVTTSGFPLDDTNFLPGLSVKYDAIFIAGTADKVGLILPELVFYNVRDVVKLSGSGANDPELVRVAERYAEGLIFLDGFYRDSSAPAVRAFSRSYKLAFREEPTILSAQGYDAAKIALSAIAHGAASRGEMTEYIRNLRFFEGVSGTTSMTPEGEPEKSVFYLTVKDGRIVEYKPEPPAPSASPEAEGDAAAPGRL